MRLIFSLAIRDVHAVYFSHICFVRQIFLILHVIILVVLIIMVMIYEIVNQYGIEK